MKIELDIDVKDIQNTMHDGYNVDLTEEQIKVIL